jgi:hypothetical protein
MPVGAPLEATVEAEPPPAPGPPPVGASATRDVRAAATAGQTFIDLLGPTLAGRYGAAYLARYSVAAPSQSEVDGADTWSVAVVGPVPDRPGRRRLRGGAHGRRLSRRPARLARRRHRCRRVAAGDPAPAPAELSVLPAGLRFPGMPAPRMFEFEDGAVDFGSVDAAPDDLGRLLLAEFALVYGNDFFQVPLPSRSARSATSGS